jgi:hypothetical protein
LTPDAGQASEADDDTPEDEPDPGLTAEKAAALIPKEIG